MLDMISSAIRIPVWMAWMAAAVLLVAGSGVGVVWATQLRPNFIARRPSNFPVAAGIPARAGEFAAIVSVQSVGERQHICAGTLVDARHVLTAAHCIQEGRAGDVSIT